MGGGHDRRIHGRRQLTATLRTDADGVPLFESLLRPTIEALRELGGSAANEELLEALIRRERIAEPVQAILHKDGRISRLSYRLAWAKTYLGKAGLLVNSARGVWALTDAGEQVTDAALEQVPAQVRAERFNTQPRHGNGNGKGPERDPEPEVLDWRETLLLTLQSMPPDAFERLSQRMLREAGFVKVEVTGKTGDGGIDGQGVLRVNLVTFQVAFQCKRYQGSVGAPVVRDFRGAMVGRADKGLILTTGTFTQAARDESIRPGAPAIDLIDGELLCQLLKDLKLGVNTKMVEEVSVDADWFRGI